MATFETCLKVLISAANFRPYLIPRLLERMLLVTNIGEAKNCLERSLRMMAVPEEKKTILVNCFREIALRMVPGAFIGHKVESVLEGSRQIFAWMFNDILEEDVSCTTLIQISRCFISCQRVKSPSICTCGIEGNDWCSHNSKSLEAYNPLK